MHISASQLQNSIGTLRHHKLENSLSLNIKNKRKSFKP